MNKFIKKKMILGMVVVVILLLLAPLVINQYIVSRMAGYITSEKNAAEIGADCILVLGAGLKPDGTPNNMLQDRLDKGIQLYNSYHFKRECKLRLSLVQSPYSTQIKTHRI